MNNPEHFIVYSYSIGDQIYQLKPATNLPNGQEISFVQSIAPTSIVQLVPADVSVHKSNAPPSIRIVENIQLHPPTVASIDPALHSDCSGKILTDESQLTEPILDVQEMVQPITVVNNQSQGMYEAVETPQIEPQKPSTDKALDDLKSMQKTKSVIRDDKPKSSVVKVKNKKKKDFIYECDVCDSRFLSATSLRLHKTGHRYGAPEQRKTWVCGFCGRHFSHQQTLGDHMKIHIDEVRYNCEACGARYSSKSGLRNHLAKHAGCNESFNERKLLRKKAEEDGKQHECDVCGKKYSHRKSMVEHRSLHYRSKQHRCERCGAMFETTGGWRKHVASGRCEFSKCKFKGKGIEEGGVFIPEERKTFLERVEEMKQKQLQREADKKDVRSSSEDEGDDAGTSLQEVVEDQCQSEPIMEPENIAVNGEESDLCNEDDSVPSPDIKEEEVSDNGKEILIDDDVMADSDCPTNESSDPFPVEENIIEEATSKEPPQRKPRKPKIHQCPTCHKIFARSFVLKNHLRIHTGERPFLCDTCSKSFSDAASLKAHIVIHTGEKSFACSECPARFARKSGLRNHITVHFNLPCDQCDEKFPSRKTLMRHKIKHQGIRPFLCEICSKDFRTKADMQAHLRIHSNEKRYICPICSARFNCPSTLRRHRNVHAPPETRPVCSTCGNSFSSQQALRKHENIHKDLKPFHCELCPKSFRVKEHLKIHQRSHSGEKPYPCDLCQKRFVTNGDLRVHMRRHTGEKPYSCEECGEAFVVTARLYRHLQQTGHRGSSKPHAIIVPDIARAT